MAVFALTIFAGAFLLFQVQPVMGKYILPWFGGSPGVWTTCLLFFQVLLLGGYAYAHLSSQRLKSRTQIILHLVLVAAALALLPITPGDAWKPPTAGDPTLRILALLMVSIGLPYFVLAATGPLVQQWFSLAKPGVSPYRLYALSNAGSLLALLSYPLLFETEFTRKAQAALWGWGLAAYAVCCAFCAIKLWRRRGADPEPQLPGPNPAADEIGETILRTMGSPMEPLDPVGTRSTASPISRREWDAVERVPALSTGRRAEPGGGIQPSAAAPLDPSARPGHPSSALDRWLWLALPACASVLLLAITNKMCQDVAVIPFLWIVPLALYLLSFIICFDNPRWYQRLPFTLALAAALGCMCWALARTAYVPVLLQIIIYSAGLFVCCMVCHGELYRLRPEPRQLTGFYLMIALGGALGGFFVAVLAPLLFNDYFELQCGLMFCGLLCLAIWIRERKAAAPGRWSFGPRWARAAVAAVGRWAMPACLAAGLAALGTALWTQAHTFDNLRVGRFRNFYGVLTIFSHADESGKMDALALMHGSTGHGMQFLEQPRAAWPTYYYGEDSGVGRAIRALPAGGRRLGLVGLGVGTLATYAQAGDYLRFYEINPEVERLATSRFSYLRNCAGKAEVVLGDARLSLEREPPQNFDLLAIDAFTSDAIPIHLLTREAFALYRRHLKTNGVIAVHITNRHLDLEPVVLRLANHFNYQTSTVEDLGSPDRWWIMRSVWVLLSRSEEALQAPGIRSGARLTRAGSTQVPLWTDDFTSLYQVVRWDTTPNMGPRFAEAEASMAGLLWERGDLRGAITRYRVALDIDPDFPEALNNLAWMLATSADASLRNGPEAVRLAERACKLTDYEKIIMVGTLAAAYAEAGRFPLAVATAEKACQLASASGDEALLKKNRELLELYRAGKPCREP